METLTPYIEKSEFTTACAVLQCALGGVELSSPWRSRGLRPRVVPQHPH